MLRFYLRVVFLSSVVFTAALVVFRVRPYDDPDLRQLVSLEGCDPMCFMGIRPGLTTAQEAEALLKVHPWVDAVTYVGTTAITWRWSGHQPAWIDTTTGGVLLIFNNQVLTIQLNSLIPFGRILLGLGKRAVLQQSRYESSYIQSGNYMLNQIAYPEHHVRFTFIMACGHQLPYSRVVSVIIDQANGDEPAATSLQNVVFGCTR
jgi:hypothetical protein